MKKQSGYNPYEDWSKKMKIFTNNKYYVEAKDLLRFPLSNFIKIPIVLKEDEVVKFESYEEIEYFRNRNDIVNYNELANLSLNEINKKIDEINRYYQKLALEWLECSERGREKLNNDENYQKKLKICKAIYTSLIDYISNKNIIDFKMNHIDLIYATQNFLKEELSCDEQILRLRKS